MSEEHKRKIGLASKGKPFSGVKCNWEGKKHTIESRQKMSLAKKGKVSSYKGKKSSEATRKKISDSLRGRCKENSRNWKGGITPLLLSVRNSEEYNLWRSEIFGRGAVCIFCGDKKLLEVDHFPVLFADIIHFSKIDSLEKALLCLPLWDINNGRVLCQKCHILSHRNKKHRKMISVENIESLVNNLT